MPVSPVVEKTRENEVLSVKKFNEFIDHFQNVSKAIVYLESERAKKGPKHVLVIRGHEVGKKEINQFWKSYYHQHNLTKKHYAKKRRGNKNKSKNNKQLRALHYVSDQIPALYKGEDFGPADPSDPDSPPLSDYLDLITEDHMANAGILTSLHSCYVRWKKLKRERKEKGELVRYMPDKKLKTCYGDTHLTFFGENILKERGIPESITDEKKLKALKDSLKLGKKSAFSRVSKIPSSKNQDEMVYDKDKGALYTSTMMVNSLYRIPPECNTDDERKALKDAKNIERGVRLNEILKANTAYYKELEKKNKKKNKNKTVPKKEETESEEESGSDDE